VEAPKIQDRKFGIQFGLALGALSLFSIWRDWPQFLVITFAGLALFHLVLAFLAPKMLSPINRAWMGLGHLLGKIVSPVVLSLIFTVLFVPLAVFMRLRGRDELKIRDRKGESFWIERQNPKLVADSFRNQY
jgi:ABC-type xylose transport system permease subunit